MTTLRQNRVLSGLITLMLLLAACKGESPTAPTSTPPPVTGTGGTTGGTGTTVTLAVANSTPTATGTTTLTATVAINGAPAANGTAVEFSTTAPGIFIDTNSATTIRTTTGGVATATLTSAAAGAVTVTARVGTVARTATVTFAAIVTTPPPLSTSPTITSVTPTSGKPQGGDVITITGTNFRAPVRVFFDTGSGTPKEGLVSSVTPTQIVVVTPSVNLGATTPTLNATITVTVGAGTANQESVNAASPFVFQIAILTPTIFAVSPPSGSKEGGTVIKITGEGFQNPVQVTLGTGAGPGPLVAAAELQVLTTTFNEITAVTPPFPATDITAPNGQVTLRVLNVTSNTATALPLAFRYISPIRIVAFGPTEGPFTGGTRVTIDGQGFDDPVAVTIGGIAAQPISVTGTKIVAITGGVSLAACADVTGAVSVTNISAQDTAIATGSFIFRVLKPAIIGVSPNPATPGSSLTITVANAVGNPRLTIGTAAVTPQSATTSPDGTTTFVVAVPPSLVLNTKTCTAGGVANVPTPFNVTFLSTTTTCTDTFTNGLTVNPPNTAIPIFNPAAFAPFISTSNTAVAPAPSNAQPSAPQTVTLVNTGFAPLTITGSSQSAGCASFSIAGVPPAGMLLNQCDPSVPITATFTQTAPTGANSVCTLSIATSAGPVNLILNGTVH
jgi:hypothetical protein